MADFYKILKADPLGDPWTSHGKTNQTFWCQVEGQDRPVSISKQVPNTLVPGQHVYGDLVYAKSQKGTEYWKLKSAKVPEGVQRPADSPAQAVAQQAVGDVSGQAPGWFTVYGNMIEYIYKEMKKMDIAEDSPSQPEPAKEVEVVAGEVDQETKETLNTIFGSEPEPEV